MPRPPARTFVASALSATALLTATACSAGPDKAPTTARAAATPTTAQSPTTTAPALTEAQARDALISDADLGEPWTPTQGAATWRDAMLKATTDLPDCRRLLDALYTEEFFGAEARTQAVVGLDDNWDEAQLRYQVVAHRPAEVDRTLGWLRTLPEKCAQFGATTARGVPQAVEVSEAALPEVGDARQALRVLLTGATEDDESLTLTVDVAVVRVGGDAIVVTNGGLGDVLNEATQAAVDLGAHRLAEVRKQGRVQV
ncbi:hypothetical protein [Streptomyces dysideae]|uniref:PknH-like extracellular domain-containing protein n=1 Tax=Streptomyces dysideae TaxID=909626 RepID=A0A101V2I6_9ACTN|nr:hypothetical protein [Streptomyces dysideae]KUO21267.1 hypothetical protein AQJ91_09840 [Streptomyces dysideae]